MKTLEYPGSYMPSVLAGELAAAGIDVLGVSATEDDTGAVTEVQVICEDDTDEQAVAAVVGDHDPAQIQADADKKALDQAWDDLYRERGARLDGCDWMAKPWAADLPDNVQAELAANEDGWVTYRQALRDLPEDTTDPFNPVWPVPPPAPLLAVAPQPDALETRRERGR